MRFGLPHPSHLIQGIHDVLHTGCLKSCHQRPMRLKLGHRVRHIRLHMGADGRGGGDVIRGPSETRPGYPFDFAEPILKDLGTSHDLLPMVLRQRVQQFGQQADLILGERFGLAQASRQLFRLPLIQQGEHIAFGQGLRFERDFGRRAQSARLSAKGIGGQLDAAARAILVKPGPVYGEAADMQLPQAVEHLVPIIPGLSQAGQPDARVVWQRLAAHAEQRRLGADLQKHVTPLLMQRLHAGGEPHWGEDVTTPVVRRGHLIRCEKTREI